MYTAVAGPQPVSQASNIPIAAPVNNHQAAANYEVAVSNHQPGSLPSQHFSTEEKNLYLANCCIYHILYKGNRRIAPKQNCTHEIKNVFMMLILG